MSVDYADYQTPQAHANAIAATGAPLLNLHNSIMNPSGPVNPSASVVAGTSAVTQPTWYGEMTLQLSAAATVPEATVTFTWLDQAGGLTVWLERWNLSAGSTAFNQYYLRGPVMGNQLQVSVKNNDPSVTLNYALNLFQGSQLVHRPDIRLLGPLFTLPATFPVPDYTDPANNILGTRSVSLGTGGAETINLPPFAGRAFFGAHTASGAIDLNVQVTTRNPAIPVASTTLIYEGISDSDGDIYAELGLPLSPISVRVKNNNASTRIITWFVTTADY